MNKKLIIFTDCGDTLVDESTQVFDQEGYVLKAEMIEGAKEALLYLYDQGYRIALVADGRVASFENILRHQKIEHVFEQFIISEALGCEKPHPLMFETAMEKMNLTTNETYRVVMIGNNLKRDILGANKMGICSILISFSPRYEMQVTCKEELPDYVVAMPSEIPDLIDLLEKQLKNKEILCYNP